MAILFRIREVAQRLESGEFDFGRQSKLSTWIIKVNVMVNTERDVEFQLHRGGEGPLRRVCVRWQTGVRGEGAR